MPTLFGITKTARMAALCQKLRVQIISDLHLEMGYPAPIINPTASVIALLGDIGSWARPDSLNAFLTYLTTLFPHVLYVPGNHEHYHNKSAVQPPFPSAVTVLNNAFVVIQGVKIIGTTLWSQVPDTQADLIARAVNDYHCIWKTPTAKITVADTNAWHATAVEYLNQTLPPQDSDEHCLVLTHHAPLIEGTSHPRYVGSAYNAAFATDLPLLVMRAHTWAFGHTHFSVDFTAGTTHLFKKNYDYG